MVEKNNFSGKSLCELKSKINLKNVLIFSIIFVFVVLFSYLGISYYTYSESSDEILGLGAEIHSVFLEKDGKVMNLKLSGGANVKKVNSVRFMFNVGEKNYSYFTDEGIDELSVDYNVTFLDKVLGLIPDYKGFYDYIINVDDVSGISNFFKVDDVLVSFYYLEGGVVKETPQLDKKKDVVKKAVEESGDEELKEMFEVAKQEKEAEEEMVEEVVNEVPVEEEVENCVPNCEGKFCGESDGCGGTCRACNFSYEVCLLSTCFRECKGEDSSLCSDVGVFCGENNDSYSCAINESTGCFYDYNYSDCSSKQMCVEGQGCVDLPECFEDSDCSSLSGLCGISTCNVSQGKCVFSYNATTDVCREAKDSECDKPEYCTGKSVNCPIDWTEPDEKVCTDDGNDCTKDLCREGECVHDVFEDYRMKCVSGKENDCISYGCDNYGQCNVPIYSSACGVGEYCDVDLGCIGREVYVRSDAKGRGNGLDWNNAYIELPSDLERGVTYYVADGVYDGYSFDDAENEEHYIYVKKATVSNHGTDDGWKDSYGDGSALFESTSSNPFVVESGYWDFDGQVGSGESGYGFKIMTDDESMRSVVNVSGSGGGVISNVNFRRCEVGGDYRVDFYEGLLKRCGNQDFLGLFYFSYVENSKIENCYVYNSPRALFYFNFSDVECFSNVEGDCNKCSSYSGECVISE